MDRRRAGTTLIEILVVIVIFAVGILAVIQIFPRGLGVLAQARNRTVAQQLARDAVEQLKARQDQLPEQIRPVVDTERSANDLGPAGDSLAQNGILSWNGTEVGDWTRYSGANVFRQIVGEGRLVPAPTQLGGNLTGSLMLLQFAPVDVTRPIRVYGRDLVRRLGNPDPQVRREGNEYFVLNAVTADLTLRLPSGPTDRAFRVTFTGYVARAAGSYAPRQFVTSTIVTPNYNALYQQYELSDVALADLVPAGTTVGGFELDSIRVSREFRNVTGGGFSAQGGSEIEPYEFMLLNPSMGVILFSPAASSERDPLLARVDYAVLDWRILRDEFRVSEGANPQHRLPLGNLKIGGQSGPDGRPNQAIFLEQTDTDIARISDPKSDHFILQDMNTGGLIAEKSWNGARQLLSVDKSLGLVKFFDADTSTPQVDAELLLPNQSGTTLVTLTNRPLRALYMANGEWSVQVLKAASTYTVTYARPQPGEYYVGGTGAIGGSPTRIYFSPSDVGRRVSFDELYYFDTGTRELRQLLGQDFQIAYPAVPDATNLPMIDVTSVSSTARFLDGQGRMRNGYAARGVKGISVAVRVLNNPTTFTLTNNPATNMRKIEEWGRNWKRSTTETYIQRGDIR